MSISLHGSSGERGAELKEIFRLADVNGDGQIDLNEFRALIAQNQVCL